MADRVKELALALVDAMPGRFEFEPGRDELQVDRVWDVKLDLLVAFSTRRGWLARPEWVKASGHKLGRMKPFEARVNAILNQKTPPPAATSRAVKEDQER